MLPELKGNKRSIKTLNSIKIKVNCRESGSLHGHQHSP